MPKNRSCRPRKKLEGYKFQKSGFDISFDLPEDVNKNSLDKFVDEFLTIAIERNGLQFLGSFGISTSGFISFKTSENQDKQHQTLIKNWLLKQPSITNICIGNLVSA